MKLFFDNLESSIFGRIFPLSSLPRVFFHSLSSSFFLCQLNPFSRKRSFFFLPFSFLFSQSPLLSSFPMHRLLSLSSLLSWSFFFLSFLSFLLSPLSTFLCPPNPPYLSCLFSPSFFISFPCLYADLLFFFDFVNPSFSVISLLPVLSLSTSDLRKEDSRYGSISSGGREERERTNFHK